MPLLILFAFISLPLIEIWILISVGAEIGALATIGATLVTAMIGTILMRNQGLATLYQVREHLDRNEMPLRPAFEGACQLVAGALLLTPGFMTDAIGLILFIPPVRTLLMAWIISRANISIVGGGAANSSPRASYDVDGDYREVHPDQLTAPLKDKQTDQKPNSKT